MSSISNHLTGNTTHSYIKTPALLTLSRHYIVSVQNGSLLKLPHCNCTEEIVLSTFIAPCRPGNEMTTFVTAYSIDVAHVGTLWCTNKLHVPGVPMAQQSTHPCLHKPGCGQLCFIWNKCVATIGPFINVKSLTNHWKLLIYLSRNTVDFLRGQGGLVHCNCKQVDD